jgi:ADP-ribose pyrophosphatase YjhB (NUDIX family)
MKTVENREHPVSISASLLLEVGNIVLDKRLILVKLAKEKKWGIVAGKFQFLPSEELLETPLETSLREMEEETDIKPQQIDFFSFLGNLHVPRTDKFQLGFIYQARLRESADRFDTGYTPSNFTEIEKVRGFTIDEIVELANNEELVYQPRFNIRLMKFWAFDTIFNKYEVWDGPEFAESVAEGRTGFDRSIRKLFVNQMSISRETPENL